VVTKFDKRKRKGGTKRREAWSKRRQQRKKLEREVAVKNLVVDGSIFNIFPEKTWWKVT